jgi:Transposase DDE domain
MSRTKTPKASKKQPPKKKPVKKRTSIVPKKKDGTIDWKRYNEALVERGSITFWIETETVEGWVEEPDVKARGGQRVYSDAAIACILTMRSVFHLALRNVEGFCRSLLAETKRDLPTPNFTTLSRRCGQLEVPLPPLAHLGRPSAIDG